MSKDRKASSEEYEAISKPILEANEITLIDPIGINELIESLEKELLNFKANVDIVLSEINSRTLIEI